MKQDIEIEIAKIIDKHFKHAIESNKRQKPLTKKLLAFINEIRLEEFEGVEEEILVEYGHDLKNRVIDDILAYLNSKIEEVKNEGSW